MQRLRWIKVQLGLRHTAKIKYVLRQQDGRACALFWIMLQTLAGEMNDGGALYLSKQIPFTARLLAENFGLSEELVEKALDLYEKLDMLSRDEEGVIHILTWDDDQETKRLEAIREAGRRRAAAYRQRQKEVEAGQEEPEVLQDSSLDEIPGPLFSAAEAYKKAFGQISFGTLQALREAEEDWGSEQVCRAIHKAQCKNISRINYILGILRNGGGERGDVTPYERPGISDEEFERMLRKAGISDDPDMDEDDGRSDAGVS